LKAERCYVKCPIDKPTGALIPGQHGKRRTKITEYGKRLREKQKAKRIAGIMERPFYNYFEQATHEPGKTGEVLLRFLETRLDNVVRRLGFSGSMAGARQLVNHGHVYVNGKRVNTASYGTNVGDVITLSDKQKGSVKIQRAISTQLHRQIPAWLELNSGLADLLGRSKDLPVDLGELKVEGTVKLQPTRDEMSYPVNEQYIVELYSK